MAATYEPIATTTLGSAAASYTFSSISSAYTDLVLITNAAITSGGGQDLQIQLGNGSVDTATNYSWTVVQGNGTTASSSSASNTATPRINGSYAAITTTPAIWITNLQNYSNTTTYKTYLGRGNNADSGATAIVGLWRSSSAINTIKIFPSGSTLAIGSTFTLYGIAAA
jgi:hypothetical protein